jgi:uncharacterized caspase-like protein
MIAETWRGYAAWLAAFVLLGAVEAQAEQRVALVIGNSTYQNASKLPNPVRDAQAVAELFESAGFGVVQARSDLGNLEFRRAIREFTEISRSADIAVIFFAGHGIEIGGMNYLLPIDAKLARDYDAEDETVPLDRIVKALEPAKRLRLIILDACRDNPFLSTMQRTAALRAVTRGLAQVEPTASNTLIAFAARAGSTAEDGDAAHSPFTTALLKHITQPGLDVHMALRRVRDEVLRNTGNRQEPFVYGSLGGEEIALVPSPPESKNPAPADSNAAIRQDYELAERIGSKGAWESFLNVHKTGLYAELARAQLAKLDVRLAATEREHADRAIREQSEREQLDRERQAREQAARDEAVQAEEKRKRLAREQTERENAAANSAGDIQTAMLTPRGEPAAVASAPKASLSGGALVQEIKTQLKRVGCYAGRIDDQWTSLDTKSSIRKFVKYANLSTTPNEPDTDFLESIRRQSQRVCPLVCGRGYHVRKDDCVKTVCKAGSVISDDGTCVKRPEKPRRPAIRAASAPAVTVSTQGGRVTSGGQVTCGRRGCQTIPKGCYAVRGAGGGGMGGKIFCP